MEEIQGGITAPSGFLCSGLRAGIKKKGRDLALIYSELPSVAAGVFTSNRVKAAPVKLTCEHLKDGRARALVANSGNANACTGRKGYEDARAVSAEAARQLGLAPEEVLVFSTGVIGVFLPVSKICGKMNALVKGLGRFKSREAAEAIITTDKFPKEAALKLCIGGAEIKMGAVAKGAGMICPDLATMLCFITTDARINADALGRALRSSVDKSFNRITVDGDCSTNDSVVIIANGASGNKKVEYGSGDYKKFREALDWLTAEMARMIVSDGEGASRFVEVRVEGARSSGEAKKACFGIANSNLVKTALAGGNPNWGRIVSAAGASGARMEEEKMRVSLGDIVVMEGGAPARCDMRKVKRHLKSPVVKITVELGSGDKRCRVWTTDLTEEYVKINREYS